MPIGIVLLMGWMAFVFLFALATLGWALWSGQLDDLESLRFLVFRDEEPQCWPGRTREGVE